MCISVEPAKNAAHLGGPDARVCARARSVHDHESVYAERRHHESGSPQGPRSPRGC